MTEEAITTLFCDTVEQSTCNEWYISRRLRILASKNVHSIKSRIKKTIESLVSDMLFPKKLDTPAMQYGRCNEPFARQEYEKLFSCKVKQVGVIVSQIQPWLCASLNEVVVEEGCITKIVEFKCPLSCEKIPVINYSEVKCNVSYLYLENNEIKLRESDCYYTQCQIQMYVSGLTICDLFIYFPVENGSCVVEIHRNEKFLREVIAMCENFYFDNCLPALRDQITKENCKKALPDLNNKATKRTFTGFDIPNKV